MPIRPEPALAESRGGFGVALTGSLRASGPPHPRAGTLLARPVELRDRAAGDDDAALARDVVDPERVTPLANVVEHRRVRGRPWISRSRTSLCERRSSSPAALISTSTPSMSASVWTISAPTSPPRSSTTASGCATCGVALVPRPTVVLVAVDVVVHRDARPLLRRRREVEAVVRGGDVRERRLRAKRQRRDALA